MNDDNNLTPEELEELQREEAQGKTGPNLYDRLNQTKNSYEDYQNIKNKIQVRKSKNISDIGSNSIKTPTNVTSTGTAATGTAAETGGAATVGSTATGVASTGTGAAATGTGAAATGTGAAATGTGAAATGTGAAAAGTGIWSAIAGAIVTILTVLGVILLIVLVIALIGILIASIYYSVVDPISTKYSVDPETVVNEYDINDVPDDAKGEDGNLLSDSDVGGIRNILNTDDLTMDELFGDVSSNKLGVIDSIRAKLYELFNWLPGSSYSGALINKIIEINLNEKLSEMGTDDKEQLPLGALLTTFTYTYASQYLDSDTNTYKDIVDSINGSAEEIDVNRVNPSTPISMIRSLFNEEILKIDDPDDIGNLLDNMVYHEFYPTYLWGEVDRKCETDEETNEETCTIYMGCMKIDNDSYRLDYDKYYMYLRFGAYVSGYAVDSSSNDYKKVGTGDTQNLWGKTGVINYKSDSKHEIAFGYEYFRNLYEAYYSSDQECKLKMYAENAVAALNDQSDGKYKYVLDGSTDTANWFFKFRDVTDGYSQINNNHEIFSDFNKYYAKADTSEEEGGNVSVKVDNTKPAGTGNFAVNYSNGESYIYQHGWIYNRFPFFRDEFQKEIGTIYPYDSIKTPKTIELQIEDIDSYKEIFNDVLGYDTSGYVSNRWTKSYNESGTEVFPLPSGKYRITSCYGPRDPINTPAGTTSNFHDGIDLAAEAGTPIYAWKEGVVVASENAYDGYGNYVVVKHTTSTGNVYTLYAHMSRRMVSVGDVVEVGDQLGTVGSTGYSSGPHLHFELRVGGDIWQQSTEVDPYPTLMELAGGEISGTCEVGEITITPNYPIYDVPDSYSKQALCVALKGAGFSDEGVAALMVNASRESSFNPNSENSDSGAYGLFQWRKDRKQNLFDFANERFGGRYYAVDTQVAFLIHELNDYPELRSALMYGNNTAVELSTMFCLDFERPQNKEQSCPKRAQSQNIASLIEYVKNDCGGASLNNTVGAGAQAIADMAMYYYQSGNPYFCYVNPDSMQIRANTFNGKTSYISDAYKPGNYLATDCNGFVAIVVRDAVGLSGVSIGDATSSDRIRITIGKPNNDQRIWGVREWAEDYFDVVAAGISEEEVKKLAKPGDIIGSYYTSRHLQIYVGDGKVIGNTGWNIGNCGKENAGTITYRTLSRANGGSNATYTIIRLKE